MQRFQGKGNKETLENLEEEDNEEEQEESPGKKVDYCNEEYMEYRRKNIQK